jgi:cation diffusion facilitator family transporter
MTDPPHSHAISMHPHPFHLHPHPHPHRSSVSTPKPEAKMNDQATSTAIEPISRTPAEPTENDLEVQRPPRYTRENDPFQLSSKLKSAKEIEMIKANTSRKRDTCVPMAGNPTKKLQGFYESQNENIERLLKPVDEHVRLAKAVDGENQLKFKIAVHGSFAANLILAVLQIYGAISSGSLSLFTTMADAIFDPLSNLTLILSNKAVNRVDPRRFPSGKARIETAGNILFCFIMTTVSAILIVMSARELAEGSTNDTKRLHIPSIIAVSIAFCTKLGLFFYCWALRNQYSQIRILWEDHRNDLFINGFGILTSVGGSKLRWWIDPMGAILLSCLIATLWLRTAYSEFQLLIGVSADTQMLQLITYICEFLAGNMFATSTDLFLAMTHSPMISAIDTVRAYYSGPRLVVEVDVVMDPNESLRSTHDVAEELQMKLESLPNVERAYVHVDYETSHKPEHFLKKEM